MRSITTLSLVLWALPAVAGTVRAPRPTASETRRVKQQRQPPRKPARERRQAAVPEDTLAALLRKR